MPLDNEKGAMNISAEIISQHARIQLVQYRFFQRPDSNLRSDDVFRIELSLSSRHSGSRASFVDWWSSQRFERIGDIFILPPNIEIRAQSDECFPLTSLVCQIDPPLILSLFDSLPEISDKMLIASLDIKNPTVRNLLLRLAQEARAPGFASEILVESIISQISVELYRIGIDVREQNGRRGLANWQLRLIDNRLRENLITPNLTELANLCRISVRQLTRGFRASRGLSIGAFVANCQIEHAKRLLATDESIASISAMLGFSTPSNFGAAFRRTVGASPSQYRRRLL